MSWFAPKRLNSQVKKSTIQVMGQRIYRDQVAMRKDLRGRDYYWIGGPEEKGPDIPGSDCTAIAEGLVSVTALGLDLTHRPTLDRMASWWHGEQLPPR